MKRVFAVFLVICLIICVFSGCQREAKPLCRVVVRMEISGQHQDLQFTRNYTDTEKIEEVLHCLRGIQSRKKGTPLKENAMRNYFLITVHLSDGDKHTYTLADHRFFKAPRKPWVEINTEITARFYGALQNA